jgi:hypothetical protein
MQKKTHLCGELKAVFDEDVSSKVAITLHHKKWYLSITTYADKETVLDGEASYEGEELTDVSIIIYHCPFCGAHLEEPGKGAKRS